MVEKPKANQSRHNIMKTLTTQQIERLIELLDEMKQEKQQEPITFAERVQATAEQTIDQKVNEYKTYLEKVEHINATFKVAIENTFSEELVNFIIQKLDEGRKHSDWSTMNAVYHKIENLHQRQLVLALSALYRLQFLDLSSADKKTKTRISQLRSQIKYATLCDHCGSIAKEITEYLQTKV